MFYVIIREEDGAFVSAPTERWSYTADLERARKFDDPSFAEALCGINEKVVPIGQARRQS